MLLTRSIANPRSRSASNKPGSAICGTVNNASMSSVGAPGVLNRGNTTNNGVANVSLPERRHQRFKRLSQRWPAGWQGTVCIAHAIAPDHVAWLPEHAFAARALLHRVAPSRAQRPANRIEPQIAGSASEPDSTRFVDERSVQKCCSQPSSMIVTPAMTCCYLMSE